jgi:hypothetical protein
MGHPAATPPPVPCAHCGASREQRCVTANGKPCAPHKNRVLLAAAAPPRKHLWRGFAYRIRCGVCNAYASVDTTGVIIAHPTPRGDQWCAASHKRDVGGKRVSLL